MVELLVFLLAGCSMVDGLNPFAPRDHTDESGPHDTSTDGPSSSDARACASRWVPWTRLSRMRSLCSAVQRSPIGAPASA